MTSLALILVLTAAFIHASWNLLAKRAGGGAAFVFLFGAFSSLIYAPLAAVVFFVARPQLGPLELGFMAGSSVLHLGYFLLLQRGYRVGDLSLVYPLARGTGPLLSTLAAILLFAERPTPLALFGGLLVVSSVFVLAGGLRLFRYRSQEAVSYGLMTGLFIASYTLWDAYAVSTLLVPPLILDWAANLGRALFLVPFALRRPEQVRAAWQDHRREVLGVAVLSPLSYILVLTALVFTPVSYIAPAREVSILIGAILGTRLLAEGDAPRRLAAASAMVLGIAALTLG